MAQYKKLTRSMVTFLNKYFKNVDTHNWGYSKNSPDELVLVNKLTGEIRSISKDRDLYGHYAIF